MKEIDFIRNNKKEFLDFFHSKFPIFHLSNVFYLDVKYATKYFLLSNNFKVSDAELESITKALIDEMTSDGTFKRVSDGTWTINHPKFRTDKPGKPAL